MRDSLATLRRAGDRFVWLTLVPGLLALTACGTIPDETAGPGNSRVSGSDQTILAKVGTQVITTGMLRESILERYFNSRALVGLVRKALFEEEAKRLGVEISQEQIHAQLLLEMDRLFGSDPEVRQRTLADLEAKGLRIVDIENEIRAEVTNTLLIATVARARREVTEAMIQSLYQKTYAQPRVRIQHIAFPFGIRGTPSNAKVQETKYRAEGVLEQITQGLDFSDAARQFSGDRDTAGRGGTIRATVQLKDNLRVDTELVNHEVLGDPTIGNQIFQLPLGEVSQPIRDRDYGYHLFRVTDRVTDKPLAEVREELRREILAASPTADEVSRIEEKLRQEHAIEILPYRFR